jgi:amino acid transporter
MPVGVIIGAGLFSITGTVAAGYTGPAITLSFAIAALGCCFAGLCYAEFASMIPVAGSAYTYSYATMGELIAWIIGWDLVLEYTVAATTVSISWSRYLVVFLEGLDIHLPQALTACPWDGGVVNIPAFLIVVLMSLFLIRGTEGSSIFNGFIVFLKVSVILIFVILGWKYINTDNYTPYIPANTGVLGEYGFSGILRGAAIVFFAFLGFDAVSTAAQETKNPKRNMPIGILEVISDGIWDWNANTGFVYRNPGWYQMLGYEPHSLDNTVFTWENLIHPDDLARVMAGDTLGVQLMHLLAEQLHGRLAIEALAEGGTRVALHFQLAAEEVSA